MSEAQQVLSRRVPVITMNITIPTVQKCICKVQNLVIPSVHLNLLGKVLISKCGMEACHNLVTAASSVPSLSLPYYTLCTSHGPLMQVPSYFLHLLPGFHTTFNPWVRHELLQYGFISPCSTYTAINLDLLSFFMLPSYPKQACRPSNHHLFSRITITVNLITSPLKLSSILND